MTLVSEGVISQMIFTHDTELTLRAACGLINTDRVDGEQLGDAAALEAFLDGWGDTQYLTTPNSQFFKKDVDPEGYNFPQAQRDAYSAWVADHTQQGGLDARNYAFVPVPEPHAWTLMLGGGILLVLFRTARKSSSRV